MSELKYLTRSRYTSGPISNAEIRRPSSCAPEFQRAQHESEVGKNPEARHRPGNEVDLCNTARSLTYWDFTIDSKGQYSALSSPNENRLCRR